MIIVLDVVVAECRQDTVESHRFVHLLVARHPLARLEKRALAARRLYQGDMVVKASAAVFVAHNPPVDLSGPPLVL